MTAANLKGLFEYSQNLPSNTTDVGSVEFGFNELKQKLHQFRKKKEGSQFTKAHYLLAGSGIAINDLENQIKSISVPAASHGNAIVPVGNETEIVDNDDSSSRREESILDSIEQSLVNAARDFDNFVSHNISSDWKKRSAEIYESFGFHAKKTRTDSKPGNKSANGFGSVNASALNSSTEFQKDNTVLNDSNNIQFIHNWGKSSIGHTILGSRRVRNEFTDLKSNDCKFINVNELKNRGQFEQYACIVYDLNNSREQLKLFPLLQKLSDVNKDSGSKQVNECWKILKFMADDRSLGELNSFGHYKHLKNKESFKLRSFMVNKNIEYLELQFLNFVNSIYHKKIIDDDENSKTDKVEELPINLNKIKYFLRTQKKHLFQNSNINRNLLIVNDVPIWALIFYLVRAGLYDDALKVVEQNNVIFKKIDHNFINYLKNFNDSVKNSGSRVLSKNYQVSILNEFNTNIKNNENIDPYKFAIYKILGKCDLNKKSFPKNFMEINSNINDWLWMNLMLINESSQVNDVNNHYKYESYTLLDLQKSVLQYDFKDLNKSNIYLHCGLYELAVKELFKISEMDAVHLSVSLIYNDLLRLKSEQKSIKSSNLVTKNDDDLFEINYAKLIGFFTRSFRISDPKVAFEYLLLINLKNKEYSNLTFEAIKELIVETKEFDLLLGTINMNGLKTPGRLENRKSLLEIGTSDINEIIEQTAERIKNEGDYKSSLSLFRLSSNSVQVILLINQILSDIFTNTDIEQGLSTDDLHYVELGKKLVCNDNTLSKLLMMNSIKTEFINRRYDSVLALLNELNLLPIQNQDNLALIKKKSENFNENQYLIKTIGNILLISMSSINELIQTLKKSEFLDDFKLNKINNLKTSSKNIMVFAGLIRYKIKKEIYIELVKLSEKISF